MQAAQKNAPTTGEAVGAQGVNAGSAHTPGRISDATDAQHLATDAATQLQVALHANRQADAKAAATLQAVAALAGFELVRMTDESFVIARWGMVKSLADAEAVRAFLRQVGALA